MKSKINNVSFFVAVLKGITKITDKAHFDVSEKEIRIRSIDPLDLCYIDVKLNPSLFENYQTKFKEKSLIVAAVKLDYINQLQHPSNIIVGQKVSRVGSKSFDIRSAVFKNNLPICCSTITSVCYDFVNSKTVPVYDEIKADHKV